MKLRLPVGLKEKVELFAKSNNRSINAEIVSRLEESIAYSESLESAFQSDAAVFEPVSMDELLQQAEIQRGISRKMVEFFERRVEMAVERALKRVILRNGSTE